MEIKKRVKKQKTKEKEFFLNLESSLKNKIINKNTSPENKFNRLL